jgi:hypothetical protein
MSHNGPPPSGWYPPPYNQSYHPHQQQYQQPPPTQQQSLPPPPPHPGMYAAHNPNPHGHHPAPNQSMPHSHHPQQQQYPSHHQPTYPQYPGTQSGYPSSSMRGTSNQSTSVGYPPAPYLDSHYGGMATNPVSTYQYHQHPYSYQQPHYGYHHQHSNVQQDSGEKSMSSENRPTPSSEVEYHHHHQQHHDSMGIPHATPRSDSRNSGQYGNYGPPSVAPSVNSSSTHHQYSSHNQQRQVHTPTFPSVYGGNVIGQSNSSAWMNYSAGTPSVPTPQTAPTPNLGIPSNHGFSNNVGRSHTPTTGNHHGIHSSYYPGSQQDHSNQHPASIAAAFPAPPPFPLQQNRSFSVPTGQGRGVPSQFDLPIATTNTSTLGNDFDPPGNHTKSDSKHDTADSYGKVKDKSLEGTRRRFSFGLQVATKFSNSNNSTPHNQDERHESDSDSIPAPPGAFAPPPSVPKYNVASKERDEEGNYGSLLQESQRQNSLQSKFDETATNANIRQGSAKTEPKESSDSCPATAQKKKNKVEENSATSKTPTFDDASLLLGLRTHSNNNSPETVPATVSHDSNEDNDSRASELKKSNALKLQITDTKAVQKREVNDGLSSSDVKIPPVDEKSIKRLSFDDPTLPALLPAPGTNNMVPLNYPKRLELPNDAVKLNSLHCLIRADLLEIFVIEPSSLKNTKHLYAPSSSVGRVGLRCVHCAMARRRFQDESTKVEKELSPDESTDDPTASATSKDGTECGHPSVDVSDGAHIARDDEAPMAVFYPKSIAEIYRLVTSWQRCHLRKCRNVPAAVRSDWNDRRESDKSRGKTTYWITSAKEIGMIDCSSRAGGIRFRIRAQPEKDNNDDTLKNTECLKASNSSEDVDEGTQTQKSCTDLPTNDAPMQMKEAEI